MDPPSSEDSDSLPRSLQGCNVDLKVWAEEKGVKFFLVSYSPLNTCAKSSMIPTSRISDVQANGCGIPSGMYYNTDASYPEVYVVPDSSFLVQLPWKPEFAWVASDLYMHGKPFAQCPRTALKKYSDKARAMGYRLMCGVEPEFLVLEQDLNASSFERDHFCLNDPGGIMGHASLLTDIHDCFQDLGWGPYMIDHEAGKGQYEINFGHAEAMVTADRFEFLKFMIKELARIKNLKVTFMPRLLEKLLASNGLHINMSLESIGSGCNLFIDNSGNDNEYGISDLARNFIAGVLNRAKQTTALMCPTVNSYKRIGTGLYCPNKITWGGNNRSVLLRVPCNSRIEYRLGDASTNLYLSQLALFASGIEGIKNLEDPGKSINDDVMLNINADLMYTRLPDTLSESLRCLGGSEFAKACLGEELTSGFVKVKRREVDLYMAKITDWEREFYIDC